MKKIYLVLFIVFFTKVFCQIAPRPNPPRLYNNLSNEFPQFLSASEAQQIEEKLEQFSNETSNQICIVIVDNLNEYDAADYAIKLGNEWGVGKKESNNGIVILIKPTQSNGGRNLFISVGYGLEGAIPDLATKRIRDEQMYPNLKEGNNYAAIDNATTVLMKLAKGEINVKDYARKHSQERIGGGLKTILIIIVLVVLLLARIFRGGGGGHTFSRGGHTMFWGGGGFGGSSFGGRGSSSGGGFGGFGGGSFGGGGSGGSW